METSLIRPSEGKPNGAAAAAVLSAAVGLLVLAISQIVTHVSAPINDAVHALGKLWMPGAEGIGPYSGKETIALLVWFASWALLHGLWRRRELKLLVVGTIALALIGIATTLIWPPLYESLGQ